MINTSSGLVLHQTGEIFASENGHFYQVNFLLGTIVMLAFKARVRDVAVIVI